MTNLEVLVLSEKFACIHAFFYNRKFYVGNDISLP
jgi:hypothetical protein